MSRVFQLRRLKQSVAQEKRIARDTGARRVAGSGSQPGNKGDVKGEGWLIEAKRTNTSGYRLDIKTWRKIEREALRTVREPAMVIEIAGRQLVVISYDTWLSLKGDY